MSARGSGRDWRHDEFEAAERHARLQREPGDQRCTTWQGEGLGTLLLTSLVAIARQYAIRRFNADLLTGNAEMMRVFRRSGYELTTSYDHGVVHVDFPIAAHAAPGAAVRR